MKETLAVIAILIVGLLLIWWLISWSRRNQNDRSTPPPVAGYGDMIQDFHERPKDLWMTDNEDRFSQNLRDSFYGYQIISSSGEVIYSNRAVEDVTMTLEYAAACSLGSYTIIRDNKRRLVHKVDNGRGRERIIYVTAPVS